MTLATITELAIEAIYSDGNVRGGGVYAGPDHDELVASIRTRGVLVPVLVTEGHRDDGRQFILVDGHRRYAAAQDAGLDRVPVRLVETEDPTDASVLAMVANVRRLNLGAVEEADAYVRILEAKGWTQKRLAASLGVSPAHVAGRLKLARLPQGVRERVAAGDVPLAVVPVIEKVADVAPALAEALVAIDPDEDATVVEPIRTARGVGEGLRGLSWQRQQQARGGESESPFLYEVRPYGMAARELDGFGLTAGAHPELAEAFTAARKAGDEWTPVALVEDESTLADQARAYGCLVEVDGHAFITDEAWMADRVAAAVAAHKPAKRGRGSAAKADEGEKEKRAREREEARVEALVAGARNRDLEQVLRVAFGATAVLSVEQARLVAAAALEQVSGKRAALVFADLHTVTETGKADKRRAKTVTVPEADAIAYLRAWVLEPANGAGVVRRAAQVLLASYLADDRVLPASGRPYVHDAALPLQHVVAATPDEVDPESVSRFEERNAYRLKGGTGYEGDDDDPLEQEGDT